MNCKHGHAYTAENTGIDARGHRYCKACKRDRARVRIGWKGGINGTGVCRAGHLVAGDNILDRGDGHPRCRRCHNNYHRMRREVKAGLDAGYSSADERFTRQLFGDRCFKCDSTQDLQVDHHYPMNLGFGLARDNAVVLCATCNQSKGTTLPQDFYTEDEFATAEYILALGAR